MINGSNKIGYQESSESTQVTYAFEATTLKTLPEAFHTATTKEVNTAVEKAKLAFGVYRKTSPRQRAHFLRLIADEIEALGSELIQRAMAESGLPEGRVTGERGRTTGQLRLFADLVEEGSWVDAVIDPAMPDRKPMPRLDIRRMLVPVGPVVVFTASNFPLAFSTAGGDTASALAAGNPVIIKAHESHLGTNELVATAILRAAEKSGMPDGVFSSLNSMGYEVGSQLVMHDDVASVAFTGSYRGGKALFDLAQKRNNPIPVFAEMGSINPVFVLPQAVQERGVALAQELAGSITLGVGQFCTNPGLIIAIDTPEARQFCEALAKAIETTQNGIMLNEGIRTNFEQKVRHLSSLDPVTLLGASLNEQLPHTVRATVATVSGSDFLEHPHLREEVFGPFSLVVLCADRLEMEAVATDLEGQLTATLMTGDDDDLYVGKLFDLLTQKVGRILFDGVPTGVEVGHAMHHGGPFPATTDSRFTSVGTKAILRFVRPVAYQRVPAALLPDALKDENPLGIWRKVNGIFTKDPL